MKVADEEAYMYDKNEKDMDIKYNLRHVNRNCEKDTNFGKRY